MLAIHLGAPWSILIKKIVRKKNKEVNISGSRNLPASLLKFTSVLLKLTIVFKGI